MKRLILFRHAKTERRAPSGDDFDRRLTERGRTDARLMGKVLAEAGLRPDVVLLSPAVRARETWEAAAGAFPDAEVVVKVGLYSADAGEIYRLAESRSEASVMVLAHNPSLQVLACDLEGRAGVKSALIEGFPTAAAAAFDLSGARPELIEAFLPRDHGGGGDD